MKIKFRLLFVLLFLLAGTACQTDRHRIVSGDQQELIVEQQGDGTLWGGATVVYIALEGGFYGLIDANDAHFDPINLPVEFQQEGLRVRFTGKIRNDLASIHQWGMIIEVTSISLL